VLCAHGICGEVGTAAEHASRLRALGRFAEVHACALRGWPGLAETVAAVRGTTVVVAPLLMAEGYTLAAVHRRLEGVARPGLRRLVCPPVGAHPRLVDIISSRALTLCGARTWRPADSALLIVGHGTERHRESSATARRHAARIAAQDVFAEVAVAFLDEPPRVPDALRALGAAQAVAVGLFVDAGEHGQEDIPALLAPAGDRAAYAGPIGPDPLISELILDQVLSALAASIAA
jgi:sirohydrochlorin cobaltochelatase